MSDSFISPYIFIICAEFLAIKIRHNKNIKGIHINGTEFKISQYADDTSIFLDGSTVSLNQTLLELEFFADISGLKLTLIRHRLYGLAPKSLVLVQSRQDGSFHGVLINLKS